MSRRALVALLLVLVAAASVEARAWSWLGVRIRDLSEPEMDELSGRHGIREGFGVVIVEVMDDTPAKRAGMRPGDIVVGFEGRPVTDTRLLQRLIARAPADDEVRLTVLRREGRQPLPVRLMPMPRAVAGERMAAEFGFVLREPETPPGQPVRPPPSTPAVTFVVRGSAAEKAGLQVGDVILQVNDEAVLTRDAAREALGEVIADRPLRLTVRRATGPVHLTLAPPDGLP
ncbi:MAG TPA: PDZ domain-containing protein [Methylomirabilota bacterium]